MDQAHMQELRNRINACTMDEMELICSEIAKNNIDILLRAVGSEFKKREEIIMAYKRISEGSY